MFNVIMHNSYKRAIIRCYKSILAFSVFFISVLLIFFSCREENEKIMPRSLNPETRTLEYYKAHSTMTNPGKYAYLYDKLPETLPELCRVVQELLLHIFHTGRYGVSLSKERKKEIRVRKVADMLQSIVNLSDQALNRPRDAKKRMISHCRDYAVLMCSFLRHQGIPARVRVGFATYFIPESHQSHWICEYWCQSKKEWIKVDAQLDDIQARFYKIDFDPLNVPADRFLYAGIEYQLIQKNSDDSHHLNAQKSQDSFCVRRCLIQDLMALNKMEVEVWDVTSFMDIDVHPNSEIAQLLHRIAEISTSPRDRLSELQTIYQKYDGLQMHKDWIP